MEENENKFCRFCLKVTKNDFQSVSEVMREICGILRLKIDFSVSRNPVVCPSCVENIQKYFDFKTVCLNTEDQIVHFATTVDGTKVNLLEVAYMKENINKINDLGANKHNVICRFCMQSKDGENCVALDALEKDFEDLVSKSIPEMDLGITKSPTICTSCMESIMGCYSFRTSCLDVENNINGYWASQKGKKKKMVNLENVYRFIIKNTVNGDEASNSLVEVKFEPEEYDPKMTIKREEIKIEAEECERVVGSSHPLPNNQDISVCYISDKIMFRCRKCKYFSKNIQHTRRHTLTHRDHLKKKDFKCRICHKELKTNTNLIAHLKRNHVNRPQVTIHKCSRCDYKSKQKNHVTRHMNTHIKKIGCHLCPKKFRFKSAVRAHMRREHLQPSRPEIYQCDKCSYSSKIKHSLVMHLLRHVDVAKAQYFHCAKCPFATLRKYTLLTHLRSHVAGRRKFACGDCSYVAYNSRYLHKHKLEHKKDLKVYQCPQCVYNTNRKNALRHHMLSHASSEEEPKFKCNSCEYETTEEKFLTWHMEIHSEAFKW